MSLRDPAFGTDGVRGVANETLTAPFALRLGIAAAHVLAAHSDCRSVIVGRDTRVSGDMLEAALTSGLAASGRTVINVGVAPTPAVSHIVVRLGAAAGAVISASHNPYEDNGIKFIGPDGRKLPDAIEAEIAGALPDALALEQPTGSEIGRIVDTGNGGASLLDGPSGSVSDARPFSHDVGGRAPVLGYIAHVAATAGGPLDGFRLVLDCANGATSAYAPALFADLGAEVHVLHASPDGLNINRNCGSTSPKDMRRAVAALGADAGLAFDGDGDRVLLCDETGSMVDGDQMLAICALGMRNRGELTGDTVIGTVMSNAGLESFLQDHGMSLVRTDVGDRYVAEAMAETGAALGGEQSGHVIFANLTRTGDGMVTGLQVLREMRSSGRKLSELKAAMPLFPQKLRSVRLVDRLGWMTNSEIQHAIAEARAALERPEWLSVRASGTEPVVRVMAQGRDAARVDAIVAQLCTLIEAHGGTAT